MTFQDFIATRVWSDDIGTIILDARWEGEPAARGYVYADSFYIEEVQADWPNNARQRGRWHLLLSNAEWISDDLATLERHLWDFAEFELNSDAGLV